MVVERSQPESGTSRGTATEYALGADLLRAIIDSAPFATMAFDTDQQLILWSTGAERVFGWSAAEVLGRRVPAEMVPAADTATSQARIKRTLAGQSVGGELVLRRTKDGREVAVEIHAGPLRDEAGRTIGFGGHMVDITRLREVERDLALVGRVGATLAGAAARVRSEDSPSTAAQWICDELRQLPAVDFAAIGVFVDRETIVLAASAEEGIPIRAGDRLPRRRAASLQQRARSGPWAQPWERLPGDGTWGDAMGASGLKAFAFGPIVHGEHIEGGVVIGTRDATFAQVLVDKWAPLVDFSTTPSALLAERLHAFRIDAEMRRDIAAVIKGQRFHAVFQPIVELTTGDVVGHEALTRFDGGRRPDAVFADAHAIGLGTELEFATLRTALQSARDLPAGRWLALNVSPVLFADPAQLRNVLDAADRPVILEITEHEVVADYEQLRAAVWSLGLDVRLAVDDAGAGVANFGHIIDLGPDFVKLDQSVIRNVNTHLGRQALVVGMRYFSRASGCRLVAEGVETEDEARTLTGLGVEFAQGFYFGAPGRVSP